MEWWTCVVLLCVTAVLADDESWTVITAQGNVRGRRDSSGQIWEFYNIPYAQGPTGLDKFKAPLPPPTWTETFDATGETRILCPQNEEVMSGMLPINKEVKEDCLIVNVFVPDTIEEKLSVFVNVHGGGFLAGYGDQIRGTQFMKEKKDFILVTFNYRIGIHGFLCLGTEDVPGNAGMKDQVALLRWVQENIASFNGNPDDVTLAGNSAGSASVDLLMLSKSAEGLFHRVIPESGGNLAAFTIQRDPYEIARTYARQLNNHAIVDNLDSLEQFYKASSMDSLTKDNFSNRTDSTFLFSPCVERDTDGAFLTESPLSILKKGDYKKVPILYGFANMEGLSLRIRYFDIWKDMMNEKFSDFLPADLKFDSDAQREEVANTIKRFYFEHNTVGTHSVLKYVDFFSDVLITYPMLRAAKLYAEAGNNQVYLYEYSFVDENVRPVPHTDVRGADHCAQTAAWVNGGDSSYETPEHQRMRATVRGIWHNFMKTGNPVSAGSWMPVWPAASANRSPYMVLNETLELRGVLLEDRTRFWDDIYDRYYRDAIPPRSGAASTAPKNIFNLFVLNILFYVTKKIVVG